MKAKQEGMQYLGRGVDIFTTEYDLTPDKDLVITLSEDMVSEQPLRKTCIILTEGSNFAEFTHKLAIEVGLKGSYKAFTGSIKTKFSSSAIESINTKFIRLRNIINATRLFIDRAILQAKLTDSFTKAVEKAEGKNWAMTVLEEFGTHVVVKVDIGGSADYICHSKETLSLDDEEFFTSAQAMYKSLGGKIEGTTDLTEEEKKKVHNVVGETSLEVYGGGTSESQALQRQQPDAWEKWADSVDNSPALLGYPKDGLLPIWELVQDEAKREALELAYKKKAAQQLKVEIFSNSCPASNRPNPQVKVPDKYKLLSGGAKVTWNGKGMLLTASFPESNNTWRALAKDHEASDSGELTVYAMALYDPDGLWEVKHFQATSAPEAHPHAEVNVESGFVMVGGGAEVHWNGEGNMLTASYPILETRDSKTSNTWKAQSKDHLESSPATITVYALGLRSKIGDYIKINQNCENTTSPQLSHPSETAAPGSEFVMVGGGAEVHWHDPGNMLTASYPNDSNDWTAQSKDHLKSSPATITAYAVGIQVSVD
jgi:hypothetical protein